MNEGRIRQVEQELLLMRQEMLELARAKSAADERVVALTTELTATRATANQVLARVLNGHGLPLPGLVAGGSAAAGTSPKVRRRGGGVGWLAGWADAVVLGTWAAGCVQWGSARYWSAACRASAAFGEHGESGSCVRAAAVAVQPAG